MHEKGLNKKLKQIQSFNIFIHFYRSKKRDNWYKLYRQNKYKKIIPIHKSLKINSQSQVDNNIILEKTLGNEILEFKNILQTKLSHVNLNYLFNNLNNIEINTQKLQLYNFIFNRKASGMYKISKNLIYVSKDGELDALYHELFHMSSSIINKKRDIMFSGFSQHSKKKNYSIGIGINEGYTQLLTKRYFDDVYEIRDAYVFEVGIAEMLEKIIGKDKMEFLYFKADLYGLVKELSKYMEFTHIMTFIDEMDYLYSIVNKNKLSNSEKKKIEKSTGYVHLFLLQCYCDKLKSDFKNNIISYEELKKYIDCFKSELYYEYSTRNYSFVSVDYIAIQFTIENALRDLFYENTQNLEENKNNVR